MRACLILVLVTGCYDSYLVGEGPDGARRDSGRSEAGVDADRLDAPGFDGSIDVGPDVRGIDVGPDALPDSGEPPPPPRPPNPETCRIEPEIFPFDAPVQEYRWPNEPVPFSDSVHVSSTPLVIDLDPTDGTALEPVLVFVSYPPMGRSEEPGVLRIVDPRTDTTITNPEDESTFPFLEGTTNLAAGDIDNDGRNEIVALGYSFGSYAFRHDGTLMWMSTYPRLQDVGGGLGSFGAVGGGPVLADLDGNGTVEIVVGRMVIAGATGELIWDETTDTAGMGINDFLGPLPCVADLDEDGTQEVISGNTVFDSEGDILWQAAVPDGLCAVADVWPAVDGPEVIIVSNGFLRILDRRDGSALWTRRLEGRSTRNVGGAPTVADFDGDGQPEIGVAYAAAYGVYDPTCAARGGGCIGPGVLWTADTSDASSAGTGSSVFDFNGDGRAEVIYNDEHMFRVYNGVNGRVEFQEPNSSRTRSENPTIADVDNDGDAEIIFSANAEARFIREFWTDPGVEVWGDRRGRWVGSRRIWNQHAYHIDNVEEDGSIPRRPAYSWRGHNSFRQNFREELDVLVVPDLWTGHGSYECLRRNVARLRIEVFNYGLERAGTVVLGIYRGDPSRGERIAEARTTRPLLPRGDSEVVTVEVEVFEPWDNLYAVVDEEETVFECREGNNEALIWRPTCP